MRVMVIVFIIFASLMLCACEAKETQDLSNQLDKVIEQTKEAVEKLAPKGTEITKFGADEIEKLFTYEYKVVDIKAHASIAEIQAELDLLGMERWEVFHVVNMPNASRLYCKRRPKSYLRYVVPSIM